MSADTTSAAASDAGSAESEETSAAADNSAYADKVLKVGVKDSVIGFGYKDPLSGEYSGMEVELAKKIADSLGFKDVEFTTVTAATRLAKLLEDDEEHNNLLRYRILFGSDYPMFEGTEGVKGIANYQASR